MFGLGIWEIAIISLIVVLILWRRRLPEIGSALGETLKEFRKSSGSSESGNGDRGRTEKDILPQQLPPVIKNAVKIKKQGDKISRLARLIGLIK